MKHAELFFAILNIVFGLVIFYVSLGKVNIGRPITPRLKWFFRLGGMFVTIWGIVSLIRYLN